MVSFMPARNRSRDLRTTVSGGLYHYLGSPKLQTYSTLEGRREYCDDFVGNRAGANGFDKRTNDVYFPRFDGEFFSGSTLLYAAYMLPAINMNPEAPDPLTQYGTIGTGTLNNAYWDILANTNPNVPAVSLPQVLGELKDIPGLVRDWGRNILKDVASGYLSWRWALRPLWSDLTKLNNFMFLTNQRFLWLKQLRDGTGLRRRHDLARDQTVTAWSASSPIHSNTFTVQARSRTTYSMRMWGTAQYKLAPGTVLPKTTDELYKLANSQTLGINSYELLAAAWELFPWSWAIDWFVNVGDIIAANNNSIPLTMSHPCLMRTISAKREFEITAKPNFITVIGSPEGFRERKERYVLSYALPFPISFPLIGDQWPILASLAALKLKI